MIQQTHKNCVPKSHDLGKTAQSKVIQSEGET